MLIQGRRDFKKKMKTPTNITREDNHELKTTHDEEIR